MPTILIMDDDPDFLRLLGLWLESEDYRVLSSHDPQQGLDLLDQESVDLVITDLRMPVMDGLTATRRIRDGDGPNADTPIVVLSASARSEDHEAGLEAGADAYLTKPIDFAALAEMMGRAAGGRAALSAAEDSPSQSAAA